MKKCVLSLLLTAFYVLNGVSQNPIITLNTAKADGMYMLISLKAKSQTNIDIDFGNGTKEEYTVETDITPITHAVSGPDIRIYASDPQKIIYLDCRNSSLRSIDLNGVTNLEWLECQENQLTALDISKNVNLKYLNCNNNQLTALDISKNTHLLTIQCKENQLTYTTLPVETAFNAFICAPQQPIAIASEYNTGLGIDLSNASNADGNKTTYTWKTKAGAALIAGTDYTISDGNTVFLKPQVDSVYCEMTNTAFPDFKDNDVLKTTNTKIIGQSLSVISMTTQKTTGSELNLTLQAWDNNIIVYIDYGNGLPVAKTIHSEETPVPGTLINSNIIKIYSAGMYYVDCSFNEITFIDISKNQELTSISCNKNQLTSLDFSQNPDLTGIDCEENVLTSVDVSKNAQLTWLSFYGNQLTSINVSQNTELLYLDVARNLLSSLDVTKNTKLTSFNCANNRLTALDMSQNSALFRLECSNNKLTFASLPIRTMTEYRYFPQQPVSIAKHYHKGDMIDLSDLNTAGSANTVYTLKTKAGTALTPGTHYSIDNGKIALLEAQADSIYCVMTNATFPYLKGNDALVTTFTKVSESATGIESIEEEYTISPNPVANTLYIKTQNTGNSKFSIFNVAGSKVKSGITKDESIDVSGLHAGVYLLHLEEEEKQARVIRFVKQ